MTTVWRRTRLLNRAEKPAVKGSGQAMLELVTKPWRRFAAPHS